MNEIEGMGVSINGVMVSVLMYADDLVLLAQTEAGLQRGINALHNDNDNDNEIILLRHKKIKIML